MIAKTIIKLLTTVSFVASVLGTMAGYSPAAEYTLVHAGYGGIAGYQLPIWVNKEIGISKKYGIELEPLLISGGALNMQALLAQSGVSPDIQLSGALHFLGRMIYAQAYTMGFRDCFLITAVVFTLGLIPAWIMGRAAGKSHEKHRPESLRAI